MQTPPQCISGLCSWPCCLASLVSCPCRQAFLIISSAPSYLAMLLSVPERTYLNIPIQVIVLFTSFSTDREGRKLLVWSQMYQSIWKADCGWFHIKWETMKKCNWNCLLPWTWLPSSWKWTPMRNNTSLEVAISSFVESNNVLISFSVLVARKLTIPFKYKILFILKATHIHTHSLSLFPFLSLCFSKMIFDLSAFFHDLLFRLSHSIIFEVGRNTNYKHINNR